MQKLAGLIILIGVAMFTYGDLTVFNTFALYDPELIESNPSGWAFTMLMWGGGAVLVSAGVTLFAWHAQSLKDDKNLKLAVYICSAVAALSALAWVIMSYWRVAVEPQEILAPNQTIDTLGVAYNLLIQVAAIVTGFILLRSGYPKWLAFLVMFLGGFVLVFWIVTGGGPPLANHVVFFLLGIALLLMPSHSPQMVPQVV
ncbi:unnamed protein product [marine sediment metagenome]|uniref:DUF4386 domain-containing protein n=1 Tax=marine sediment metagenome TaxID=412755 RepID=X1CLL3_9ZZZZ